MKDVLAAPELRVKRDGRLVAMVGLDEDDLRTIGGGNGAKLGNHCGGNAEPARVFANGEVINVEFASFGLYI